MSQLALVLSPQEDDNISFDEAREMVLEWQRKQGTI